MANSSTILDLVSASQANKEVTVNALADAASPAMLYGRRASMTAGLTWGYYGGTVSISGTPTQIANGTVTLAASTTNYVEANPVDGSVSVNQIGFTAGRMSLYQVVTGAATVTSYTDVRVLGGGGGGSGTVKSVNTKTPDSSGAVTLTASDVGADASGAAAAAISAHDADADPHPQYLTQTEGDTRYPLASTEGAANGLATLGSDGKVPASQLPASATAGGTVTSVGLSVPGVLYTVSGSPITGSGTLTFTLNPQAANTFLAGPTSGGSAAPTMRALTIGDLSFTDTDTTLSANSDSKLATQKAVKAYVDNTVTGGAAGVMVFKGSIDCSANPNYPAASAGHVYKVSVAGRIGGGLGPAVEVGDTLYCTATAAAGDQSTVGGSWNVVQENIDGAVVGPASSTDGHVALFNGATGKIIKDSGLTLAGTNTGDETVTTTGALIHNATAKSTLVDADEMDLTDSAASFVMKKITWANVKATLKVYFDALYATFGEVVNAQTGTSYTYVNSDMGKLVTHSNGSAMAGTLPQAGTGGSFSANWWVDVQNRGTGTLTITPTTSTIDGAASLSLSAGQGVRIVSDGTNYFTQRGCGGSSGGSAAGGSTTQMQFNDGGTIAGASTLLWDKTTNTLSVGTNTAVGVTIRGVAATTATSTAGAPISIIGGTGSGTSAGGKVSVWGGTPGSSGVGGNVEIYGSDPGGTGGGTVLVKGGPRSGAAGSVTVSGGDGLTSGTGGTLTLNGGDATAGTTSGSATLRGGDGASGATGGNVTIRGGAGTRSTFNGSIAPGTVSITGGAASGTNNQAAGGAVTINGGQGGAVSGVGGNVTIQGGAPQADNGGSVTIQGAAGVGTNKNGGSVTLTPGAATGTGTPGNVVLNGSGAALATTAIGGFACIPTCAGAPTGTPANIPAGTVPMVFDTTNKKLWMYVGSSWVGVVLS